MTERVYLDGPINGGGFKWCVFPCQKRDESGNRIDRQCRVATDPRYDGKVWQVSGETDAPTLSPSIDCLSENCWHGFIVNGEVKP